MKKIWIGGVIAMATLSIGIVSGCSNSSLVIPYTSQLSDVRTDITKNNISSAEKVLQNPASKGGAQQNLYLSELARTQQFGYQYSDSMQNYALVEQIIYNQNMAAQVQLSQVTNSALSLFTNDNIQNYQLPGYEQILVYNYQALNYLFSNNLSGALVEARRADDAQEFQAQMNAKQHQAYEQAKQQQNFNIQADDYKKRYASMIEAAKEVPNSYQNPYTFYVTGMIFELQGDYTDALIDYKSALAIDPSNTYIQQKVMDMQYKNGSTSALNASQKAFGLTYQVQVSGSGQLVVLYEQNFVPMKTSINLPIVVNNVLHNISLPIYAGPFPPIAPLTLTNNTTGQSMGQTQTIVSVQALAAKALDEQMPMIMLRSVLRFITQQATTQAVNNQSPLAGLALNIFNVVTSDADLRSWVTLPNNAQISNQYMSSGNYMYQLSSSYGISGNIPVNIVAGHTTILWVMQVGGQFYTRAITY